MVEVVNFSKQGKNKLNQDAILYLKLNDDCYLFAIADGVGGHKGGALASNYTLYIVEQVLKENINISFNILVKEIVNRLTFFAETLKDFSNLATTLTIGLLKNNMMYTAHIGDCRIYHLRGDGIMSRTKDQTELQKLIDDDVLTKRMAKNYHRKNILLSVLSPKNEFIIEENSFEVLKGDKVIFLSDGVYNVIKNKIYFRDLAKKNNTLKEFSNEIEKTIEEKGIIDDYSAILIEIK